MENGTELQPGLSKEDWKVTLSIKRFVPETDDDVKESRRFEVENPPLEDDEMGSEVDVNELESQ